MKTYLCSKTLFISFFSIKCQITLFVPEGQLHVEQHSAAVEKNLSIFHKIKPVISTINNTFLAD